MSVKKNTCERKQLLVVWLKSLPPGQRDEVLALAETLVGEVCARQDKRVKFGVVSAMEVIWAVGRYLNSPPPRPRGMNDE